MSVVVKICVTELTYTWSLHKLLFCDGKFSS